MKHKTRELTGALLDASVARAEGWKVEKVPPDVSGENGGDFVLLPPGLLKAGWEWPRKGQVISFIHPYSTHWQFGGPIIDRERISVEARFDREWSAIVGEQISGYEPPEGMVHGPTPLVAAMRAYVESKFGFEVDF